MPMKSRISDNEDVARSVRERYDNGLGAMAIASSLGLDVTTVQTEIRYQQSQGMITKPRLQRFVYAFG